jgi:hypothetical protein
LEATSADSWNENIAAAVACSGSNHEKDPVSAGAAKPRLARATGAVCASSNRVNNSSLRSRNWSIAGIGSR